ncbi:hypothetical protein Bca52824_063209 [Brassica carinata]|uniref:Uncharacterized protein n=1 Tax=Brassica carinata TaxID=52824 RepID=A0A8X7QDY2_BRACI|nr:hypothetical protein Bca52824_063209 [Brassica carinata]
MSSQEKAASSPMTQWDHMRRLDTVLKDTITPLSEPEAVDLVNTVFASATERDIYTGDKLEIMILKADDIRTEVMELRKD